jgi:hypothetical protein
MPDLLIRRLVGVLVTSSAQLTCLRITDGDRLRVAYLLAVLLSSPTAWSAAIALTCAGRAPSS